jgi:hypothetical protein
LPEAANRSKEKDTAFTIIGNRAQGGVKMIYYFTDEEINRLTLENKNYNGRVENLLHFRESDGHKKATFEMPRADGRMFVIKLRQNINTVTDFSAILAYQEKGANKDFKLRRYNGKHEHTNKLENRKFFDFHIHYATSTLSGRRAQRRKLCRGNKPIFGY